MHKYQKECDDFLISQKVLPVCTFTEKDKAVELARSLVQKGVLVMEIAYRNENLYSDIDDCIREVKKQVPQIRVGAATVTNPKIALRAKKSGADFLVSPGFNPKTVRWAKLRKMPFYPGVVTPSEIEVARQYGFSLLKFFPAEASGGAVMLKNLASPFPEVRFIVSGGINEQNEEAYRALSNVSVISGTYLSK